MFKQGPTALLAAEGTAVNALLWLNGMDWTTLTGRVRSKDFPQLFAEAKADPNLHPANTAASRSRVEEIVKLLTELMHYQLHGEVWGGVWGDFPSDWPERLRLSMAINERVGMFRETLGVQLTPVPNQRAKLDFHSGGVACESRPNGEAMAVGSILHLVQAGHLDKLRRCKCESWFFARRKDQVFCSDVCRRRTYESKPAYKAKRKPYLKAYYIKSKQGIGVFRKATHAKS